MAVKFEQHYISKDLQMTNTRLHKAVKNWE